MKEGRELVLGRWGSPSPHLALKGKKTDAGGTNIRNVKSSHWRRWLRPGCRYLVPFTSLSESELSQGGLRQPRAVQRCCLSVTGSVLPHMRNEVRPPLARGIPEQANV